MSDNNAKRLTAGTIGKRKRIAVGVTLFS